MVQPRPARRARLARVGASSVSRLVVTGAGGQLGRAVRALEPGALGLGRDALDITDPEAVRAVLRAGDVVVNCAAYTGVDAAETDEAAAFAGNETGPAVLAAACTALGARLIHVSTDYVFDGAGTRPYEPDDPTGPTSVYGRSKLAGERAVLKLAPAAHIVRTAWVYTGDQGDFVATMRRLERERDTVSVVNDQIGSPTFAVDLAAGLLELAARPDAPRILHATNAGRASWFELARAVFEELGADPERVRPCTSAQFPSPVRRPAYSVLSNRGWVAAGLTPLRDWRLALTDALARISG
ncbi:dTDP-4-dehydrorhamnose reductase [Nocardia sp. CDC159]|uniref:dTDP-4-dehydrorhamnose reductase n=1 Tax=Nocardia pulmonis TaxID=2951408 RepID=A0A9X2IZ86_9NOCA|nr:MULTISPECIES: dTDP-4-dehydrorhamnose reductase [Nocardia]MCM6775750.1 dTDP-4-dehydrorhamnose reductase [Nocardia pulmonis]MCM6788274.1 dTDP-4-dehydrorhamnose reductase [Nocardia sp. CDC159]